jgi:signal transduction histidine kinase/CheY-like chemotaxis protein
MSMAFASIRIPAGLASGHMDPALTARVRADQIATLFTQWWRTTASMLLGASILTVVMWGTAPPHLFAAWLAAIIANQAWRHQLARRYRAVAPAPLERQRWGHAWALGSTIAGALWGVAAVTLFVPGDIGHQSLLIVCLFGVALGGVDLTAVYKPSFYGFVLPALGPLILRVAYTGDQVHVFLASVMLVVLAFILRSGRNLNALMAQSLAIRYENLDLIRELQAQTAAADAARASAEEANRGKTQFLAAASHDLRQPLHAMGLLAAALSAKVREPAARDIVGSIKLSVEALERLFSALMDISKLDAGGVAPARAPVALAALFGRIERQFAPLAASRGLRLAVVQTRAWVDSDAVLLERIVANLVANALNYTERGGAVVGVRRRAGKLWIDVVDSGIGIAAGDRDRIFDEFYRAGTGRVSGRQGMGLGLAIVRRLARLLDHPFVLASAPERGSRFSVAVQRVAPDRAAIASPCPPRPAAMNSLAGAVVAVIDDEPAVVDGMSACFAQWQATVVGAASADEIVEALGDAGRYPDLIIADYRLADGVRGTEVVERLRDEFGVDVPAMLVSGDASPDAIALMHASRLDVLLKPVVPELLRVTAERLLHATAEPAAASAVGGCASQKKAPHEGAPEDRPGSG